MQCGLLGKKLGHSYSPQIHNQLGNYQYTLYEKEPEHLEPFLKSGEFDGINVTIPYKKSVISYCSQLSARAQKLGSVNTIVRKSDGSLIGHNTDYFGFLSMVEKTKLSLNGKKVLVLGSGGASVTAVAVLEELGAQVITISRSGENNYTNLDLHKDAAVIINATPVGMYPDTENMPVDLAQFPHLEGVLDLIYNPSNTRLLQDAQRRGIVHENGLWMLVAQAKESAEWFTGQKIDDAIIPVIYKKLRQQMENIVLIGMPGCGKSTIGKLLAAESGKTFVDADDEIIKYAGMRIPEIFHQQGELGFRQIESTVLSDLGKRSGLVIATGGGCVTQKSNYSYLHQNGKIIWIQRDLSQLPTDGRPLSQGSDLSKMYEVRKPLYEAFADLTVTNVTTAEGTATSIIELLKGGE